MEILNGQLNEDDRPWSLIRYD